MAINVILNNFLMFFFFEIGIYTSLLELYKNVDNIMRYYSLDTIIYLYKLHDSIKRIFVYINNSYGRYITLYLKRF